MSFISDERGMTAPELFLAVVFVASVLFSIAFMVLLLGLMAKSLFTGM